MNSLCQKCNEMHSKRNLFFLKFKEEINRIKYTIDLKYIKEKNQIKQSTTEIGSYVS